MCVFMFKLSLCRSRNPIQLQELSFVAQRNETLGHEVDVLSAKATAAANDARDAKQELLRQVFIVFLMIMLWI